MAHSPDDCPTGINAESALLLQIELERRAEDQIYAEKDSPLSPANRLGTISMFKPWFPETDPNHKRAQTLRTRLSDRSTALAIHQSITIIIFLLNTAVTIWILCSYDSNRSLGDASTGDCGDTKYLNTLLHWLINLLSSLLLGSSNYCAQILVAPTREEVDKAHHSRTWLDIGSPSVRNLLKGRISGRRRALWLALMLSSTLLHLLWNSAFFSTFPIGKYSFAVVTKDYDKVDKRPWDISGMNTSVDTSVLHDNLLSRRNLTFLNKTECLKTYLNTNQGLGDLVLVSSNITTTDQQSVSPTKNSSLLSIHDNIYTTTDWIWATAWICSAFGGPGWRPQHWCDEDFLLPMADNWTLYLWATFPGPNSSSIASYWSGIDHCWSSGNQSFQNACAVRFNAQILLFVCLVNLVKCFCIFATWRMHYIQTKAAQIPEIGTARMYPPAGASLVTIGDAVASFLQKRDFTTKELSFVGVHDFVKRWPQEYVPPVQRQSRLLRKTYWFQAASRRRWVFTISLCAIILIVVSILLGFSLDQQRYRGLPTDWSSLRKRGLGKAEPHSTILRSLTGKKALYMSALFANMWQIIFSAAYVAFNGLLTTLCVAEEWSHFAIERKALRLSSPRGIQRSSYFLSLPFRFSLPLLAASSVLHWLISESCFVVQTRTYAWNIVTGDIERQELLDSSMVGYSSIGIALSLMVGCLLVLSLLALGFKTLPTRQQQSGEVPLQCIGMPLASTCSAAISAACHRLDEGEDAHLLPVQWGIAKPGRWCFTTAYDVKYPPVTI